MMAVAAAAVAPPAALAMLRDALGSRQQHRPTLPRAAVAGRGAGAAGADDAAAGTWCAVELRIRDGESANCL